MVHAHVVSDPFFLDRQLTPFSQCSCPVSFEMVSAGKVTFKVEVVVDRCVD